MSKHLIHLLWLGSVRAGFSGLGLGLGLGLVPDFFPGRQVLIRDLMLNEESPGPAFTAEVSDSSVKAKGHTGFKEDPQSFLCF